MSEHDKDDDRPFQHYTFRHRMEAWISQSLFDWITYKVRRGLLKGMTRRGGLAWIPEYIVPAPDTPETRLWRTIDLNGLVVYDIGAFHGLMSIYFARHASQVVCFEPNPKNLKRLKENVRLNTLQNVQAFGIGLGATNEFVELVISDLMPGGGSVDARVAAQIRSSERTSQVERIKVFKLDTFIGEARLPPPSFVKIDVEGFEAQVLRGSEATLRQYLPQLLLEMHGDTMREKRRKALEIVQLLLDFGYNNLHHLESNTTITTSNSDTAAEGHIYAINERRN